MEKPKFSPFPWLYSEGKNKFNPFRKGKSFMKELIVSIETKSDVDLKTHGICKHAASRKFSLTLFGFSKDSGPAQVLDIEDGETLPGEILDALKDEKVIKWSFEADFERICISRYLGMPAGEYLSPRSWRSIKASCEKLGISMKLPQKEQIISKQLLRRFRTPSAANIHPYYSARARYIEYAKRKVEHAAELRGKLLQAEGKEVGSY